MRDVNGCQENARERQSRQRLKNMLVSLYIYDVAGHPVSVCGGENMKYKLLILTLAVFCSGCATLQRRSQPVALTAIYQDQYVQAFCRLTNDKGTWEARSPSRMLVRKSAADLQITCEKDGLPTGILTVVSLSADSKSYSYPDRVTVELGKEAVIGARVSPVSTEAPAAY